jgi:hypothetical protein
MDLRDARFHHDGSIIPPGAQRTDHYGRSVYVIAPDGQLFGKHILSYLVTNDANISSFPKISSFGVNEATLLYGLDALSHLFNITSSFHPEENGDQGGLYLLGLEPTRVHQPNTKIHTPETLSMSRVGST